MSSWCCSSTWPRRLARPLGRRRLFYKFRTSSGGTTRTYKSMDIAVVTLKLGSLIGSEKNLMCRKGWYHQAHERTQRGTTENVTRQPQSRHRSKDRRTYCHSRLILRLCVPKSVTTCCEQKVFGLRIRLRIRLKFHCSPTVYNLRRCKRRQPTIEGRYSTSLV